MAHSYKSIKTLSIATIISTVMVTASVANGTIPCDKAWDQLWSTTDAAGFEVIESQVFTMKVNANGGAPADFVSFPNEQDGC